MTRQSDTHLAIIEALAPLLYGPRWGRELARVLGCDDRLVRRWKARERPVPEWVIDRLLALADERGTRLAAAAQLARSLLGRS